MKYHSLGKLFDVSELTLGGGGIGQVWGTTTQEEAIATTRLAYDSGITFFDMAPLYGQGEAEHVMGLAFKDGYPEDLRVTTKCMVGGIPPEQIESRLISSLEESLARMGRSSVDVFILHGYVIPDGWNEAIRPNALPHIAVEYSNYMNHVVPTFEKLMGQGRIHGFGVTAASVQSANQAVLNHDRKPDVVQCITNLLDSPGNMAITAETPNPREIIKQAARESVGVMGIRAVAAGALADAIDRDVKASSGEARDYARSSGYRKLAADMGESAAQLAHRYALSMEGVETVVLGVKDRDELRQCLDAAERGLLSSEQVKAVDDSVSI